MEPQIFTKEFIFERIKDSGFPFWSLGLWQGFKNVANVMSYYGGDFEDEDTDETKVEKSIMRLDNTLSTFPDGSVFVIEIKNSRQANGSGIIGPFQFRAADKEPETSVQPLGGAPSAPPTGYVSESVLKGVQESIQREFDAKLERYKADMEKKRQADELQRRIDAIEQREKEVKDMEKSYNSSVAKVADVLIEIGKRLGTYFIAPGGGAAQASAAPQLGHAAPPPDEKAQAVDDFAEFLYNNFSTDAIRNLQQNITNYATTHMAQPADGAAADTDTDGQ